MFIIKQFNELTTDELYDILAVRTAVFVVEQTCPYQEVDGIDKRACHVYWLEDGKILAYLRVFHDESDPSLAHMGRILTVRRGIGLGARLLDEGIRVARETMGAKRIYIEAQVYARGFYERAGFIKTTEEFLEDGIPHMGMELTLGK